MTLDLGPLLGASASEDAIVAGALSTQREVRDWGWHQLLQVAGPDPRVALREDVTASRGLVLKPALARLAVAMDQDGRRVPPRWATVLRAARQREELRSATLRRILAPALERVQHLASAGEVVAVGGGLAVAALTEQGATRHVHDLDLFVRVDAMTALLKSLRSVGFLSTAAEPGAEAERRGRVRRLVHLRHASGLPVSVRTELRPGLAWAAAGVVEAPVLGAGVPTAARADLCVHVALAGMVGASRTSATWLADLAELLRVPDRPGLERQVQRTAQSGDRAAVVAAATSRAATIGSAQEPSATVSGDADQVATLVRDLRDVGIPPAELLRRAAGSDPRRRAGLVVAVARGLAWPPAALRDDVSGLDRLVRVGRRSLAGRG